MAGMPGQIDGIGYDGGRGIGLRGRARQHGDGVGNPKRKTAAVTPAGRDTRGPASSASMVMVRITPCRSGRSIRPTVNCSPSAEMQRDIAAIVDIGARRAAPRGSIAPRISSATLPATAAIGVMKRSVANGATARMHAARDNALQRTCGGSAALRSSTSSSQSSSSRPAKALRRGLIGNAHISRLPFASTIRSIGPSCKCSRLPSGEASAICGSRFMRAVPADIGHRAEFGVVPQRRQRPDVIHVAAERGIVGQLQREPIGATSAGVGT